VHRSDETDSKGCFTRESLVRGGYLCVARPNDVNTPSFDANGLVPLADFFPKFSLIIVIIMMLVVVLLLSTEGKHEKNRRMYSQHKHYIFNCLIFTLCLEGQISYLRIMEL